MSRSRSSFKDLVLMANTDTPYTFRQKGADQEHTAQVTFGPEGPMVRVDD